MAITEKELKAAIAKLKERNALEANPTERMSVAEWKARHAAPSLDAIRVEEDSKKVQSKIAESVTKTDGDGLNATMKKVVDEVKKQTEGITKLVTQSKEQSDAIASLAENTELTRGPIEKMVSFVSNMREKLSTKNIKETVLTKAASTFGGIPLVGSMIKKSAEKESWIKTQMKIDPTAKREQLSKDWGSFREAHKETRAASAEYEKTRKMFGMSDSQFAKTPEGKRLLSQQVEATTKLAKYDRRANLIANEGESETREPPNREPKTKDEERLIEKLKPETGQEVTFDKQQYRFLGQQWAEVGEGGKTGRMAERGIVKELNRLAGVDPAVNATRKEAGDTGALENLRKAEEYTDEQIEVLRKIEENTRPSQVAGGAKARALPAKGKEVTFSGQKYRFQGQQWVEINEKTGKQGRIAERGIVGELNKRAGVPAQNRGPERASSGPGIGAKVQAISKGMVEAAKGIAAIGGALIVLSFGLKSLAEVEWESMLKAGVAIGGLVVMSKLIGDNVGSMLKGALAIAALGGSLLVASMGFKAFAELDWETLAKAGVALGGLALAAAGIGAFAAPIAIGAAVIAGLGAAVWVLGEGLQAVGESVNLFVDSIERLGNIDGSNLIEVGAGLAAVAAGIVAFGAANAVAGVTNLVSGFLGAITPGKTPVEQLLEIAEAGQNIQAAGTGIQTFAEGLTKFSAVDKDKLEIIADLPNDKIIALGEAIGRATPQTANAVYGASAENAGAAMGGAGTTNNVVAPTTVNNTTNQVGGYKPDVRNQDSSFKRMLDARYVPV